MTREILIEYVKMKGEIKDLRRRIEKDRRELAKLNNLTVTDSVACGKKGKKPLRTVKIEGRPETAIGRKERILERRVERLEALEEDLLLKQAQAEEYIQGIERSEIRMIFRFYFLDGMSYIKVAKEMNKAFPSRQIRYTDENIKKKIQRFFSKCPEMSPNVPKKDDIV